MPCVFIIGIGSDIGYEIGIKYQMDGWIVVGTYRRLEKRLEQFENIIYCELLDNASLAEMVKQVAKLEYKWDLVVVASGTEEPIGNFFNCDHLQWENAIQINALAPLKLVREIYPFRNQAGNSSVVFFSGSGTNNAVINYSAYSSSKLLLIKMCELLDAESVDTKFFIIGPGIVMTKIHQQTLKAGKRGAENYEKVLDLYRDPKKTTSHQEIYMCINWCHKQDKSVIGGRNLSLVFDEWRHGGALLADKLRKCPDMYKMRRFGNDFMISGGEQ